MSVTGWVAALIAVVLLVACLGAAVLRPRGLSEAVVAIPAAGLVVALGIVPAGAALATIRQLASTVAFLAAILVFGHLCAQAGVFDYLGSRAARSSRGRAPRLLGLVVGLASSVTAVLTLDATVVLLTPVVLRTARRLRLPARPHAYACAQLANAGSLLLPVSNLTNLLAFGAAGVSFGSFAAVMALPWIAATALEWLGLRLFFRRDLTTTSLEPREAEPAPRYALAVLAVTVAGFVVTSALDVPPAWAALGGVLLLGVPRLARRATTPLSMLREANLGFGAFVLCLGVIVDGVTRHGLLDALKHVTPSGSGLVAMLGLAFLAALLANVVNNLPATLALLPLVTGNPAAVLAVLIGVNVGPNATYAGSLATLLWRRLLPAPERPRAGEFHAYGLLSVPVIIAVTTVLLWAGIGVVGG